MSMSIFSTPKSSDTSGAKSASVFPKATTPVPATSPAVAPAATKTDPDPDDGFGVPDDVADNPLLRDAGDGFTKDKKASTELPPLSDVVSEGTRIDGNFSSEGNVEVRGKIKGDVYCKGYVLLNNAEIDGNVTGIGGVYMKDGFVHGSISSSETVDIGGRVDGAVSGNTVIVREDGVIHGPYLHCQLITTVTGAQIDCAVKTGYAEDVSSDKAAAIPMADMEIKTPSSVAKKDDASERPNPTSKKDDADSFQTVLPSCETGGNKIPLRIHTHDTGSASSVPNKNGEQTTDRESKAQEIFEKIMGETGNSPV